MSFFAAIFMLFTFYACSHASLKVDCDWWKFYYKKCENFFWTQCKRIRL